MSRGPQGCRSKKHLLIGWVLSGRESACQGKRCRRCLGREDSLEGETTTHSSILAWIFPWTRNLAGYSSWVGRLKQIEHRIVYSMQACTHTHMQTLTHACTHWTYLLQGPGRKRPVDSTWTLCISGRGISACLEI